MTDQSQIDQGPEIDSELQAHIGRHLKASYDDILSQDVPDRFRDLLSQLEAKEGGDAGAKGGKK
ncbi:NepR family anti-sigma factor [Terrihabitans soli]|uniref:NepR family anti-sigma factor n=1 Tax=Terrihabitans soli TaxID=708113 RepID=UPI001CEC79E9|nr:NepR family anti-sigma factor [Terrihabitans soli]